MYFLYSLKALIAEKVREVERESRRRIKHFIRNKQVRDAPISDSVLHKELAYILSQ